jgi:hypothetical protein
MDKYYVLVVGKGQTSRANLEALMEDHYYANGPDGILVLAFKDKPSQGQVFAAQLAKDKSKEIIVFAPEGANFNGLVSSSITNDANPLESAIKFVAKDKSSIFVLWDDEDTECQNTVSLCNDLKVNCYDLTDGLNQIKSSGKVEVAEEPSIPVQEQIPLLITEDFEAEEEDDEEETEEVEEDELTDEIYFGIQALVKAIAKAVVAEIQDAPKTARKAPKA